MYHPNGCFISNIKKYMGEHLSICTCKIKQIITEIFLGQFTWSRTLYYTLRTIPVSKTKTGQLCRFPFQI